MRERAKKRKDPARGIVRMFSASGDRGPDYEAVEVMTGAGWEEVSWADSYQQAVVIRAAIRYAVERDRKERK